MIRKLVTLLVMVTMVLTPVFGASSNNVDRNLAVKDDYSFEPGKAFVYFRVQETQANDFGAASVNFTLKINKAEWFKTGDPVTSDPAAMATDTSLTVGATISIQRVSDTELVVTLNRSAASASDKASWQIPIYAKVKEAGIVSLQVDGRDGLISSGDYPIAEAHGGDNLSGGYQFTPENPQWMTIREPANNAFEGVQKFRLVLDNGSWFPESDSRLGPQAMLKAASVSGIEAGSIVSMVLIDNKTLEVTLQRGQGSSIKAMGVWSLPLYFTVDQFGQAKVTVVPVSGGLINSGTLGTQMVTEPITYIKKVTLTLNQPDIVLAQGAEQQIKALDVSPVNLEGSTMVPVRGVFEQLGASVQWNSIERTVTIVSPNKKIILNASSATANVNGADVQLSKSPVIINGRLLIPLRSLSEQLGFGVEWLQATQQIIIRQD